MSRYDELMSCRGFILDALRAEMAKRHLVNDLAWIELERQAVAIAANQWGQAHGHRSDVTVTDVKRIETLAVGHVDYASKLALYVAEHVLGLPARGT